MHLRTISFGTAYGQYFDGSIPNFFVVGASMKRLVIALLAATSLSAVSGQISSAADLPMKAPSMIAAPLPFSWAGFYAGVNAGYAWGNNDVNVSSTPVFVNTTNFGNPLIVNTAAAGGTASLSPDNGAFIGGIQAGYNWQFNSIVAGIEADFQGLAGNNGSGSTGSILAVPGSGNPLTTTMSASQQVDWLGTLRGRLGVTVTPTLLAYMTGGLAYGEAKSSFTMTQSHLTAGYGITSGTLAASYSGVRAGWTLGAGMEWAFDRNWSAKAEYLYYDLGTATYGGSLTSITAGGGGLTRYVIGSTASADFTGNIIRVGLNYKF